MVNMRKLFIASIIFLILIFLSSLIFASSPSINYLSKGLADLLYCTIDGNCFDIDAETPFYINAESCIDTPCTINVSKYEGNYTMRARPARMILLESQL